MITVVSGLPRSGTSLMMNMLQAGGMELLTDDLRKADNHNPNGYFEYQKVKLIETDQSWLPAAENKAIKIIVPLLQFLPDDFTYSVIFMERDLEEILMSQNNMLKDYNKSFTAEAKDHLKSGFIKELKNSKKYLTTRSNIKTLFIHYSELIEKPVHFSNRVNDFLGVQLAVSKMAEIVNKNLYRQKI